MATPITERQLKKIWASSHELGLTERQVRNIAKKVSGGRSISALSKGDAARVIDRIEGKRPKPDSIPSPGHLAGIRRLKEDIGWEADHFKAWLEKYFKVQDPEQLNRKQAQGAFVALMRIAARAKGGGQ